MRLEKRGRFLIASRHVVGPHEVAHVEARQGCGELTVNGAQSPMTFRQLANAQMCVRVRVRYRLPERVPRRHGDRVLAPEEQGLPVHVCAPFEESSSLVAPPFGSAPSDEW